jgi:hypothetical protein
MENESDITKKSNHGGNAPHHLVQLIVQKSLGAITLPHNWYKDRQQAEARLQALSNGNLVLLSNIYSRDDERHQLVHEGCGLPFAASLDEVKKIGPDKICPYCHLADDLTRFGAVEQVQYYVIEASQSAVYFYASNTLGSPDDQYSFLCMLHRRLFQATFTDFQMSRGKTNGCPLCEADASFRSHNSP